MAQSNNIITNRNFDDNYTGNVGIVGIVGAKHSHGDIDNFTDNTNGNASPHGH